MLSVQEAKEKIDQAVALLAETGLYVTMTVIPPNRRTEYLQLIPEVNTEDAKDRYVRRTVAEKKKSDTVWWAVLVSK